MPTKDLRPTPANLSNASLIYFSSRSGNTRRFIDKLGLPAQAIEAGNDETLRASRPYILVVPTYGGGQLTGAVPKPVIRFLNLATNRVLLRGVIAAGNTSFGSAFALAGRVIAAKCRVPLLHRFELLGTAEDVHTVRKGIRECWLPHP